MMARTGRKKITLPGIIDEDLKRLFPMLKEARRRISGSE